MNFCASYSQSVLRFDDTAVKDGGFHVMGNGDDSRHLFARRREDGVPHFFQEVLCVHSSAPFRKEAVLSVQTVLGLDLARGVVLNAGQDTQLLSWVNTFKPLVLQPSVTVELEVQL